MMTYSTDFATDLTEWTGCNDRGTKRSREWLERFHPVERSELKMARNVVTLRIG